MSGIAKQIDEITATLKKSNDEADWDDVENYFDGPACWKCDYLRGNQDGERWCGLLRSWKGLGREPQPSDCKGVTKQLED